MFLSSLGSAPSSPAPRSAGPSSWTTNQDALSCLPVDSGHSRSGNELGKLARLFLKLGIIAFGGPAAHIAMMREEVVTRRKWMEDQEFLDLVGATNLIPGPNSTELAIHLGRVRAGWRGLVVAGACFIVPAALIVLFFAVLYALLRQHPGRPNVCCTGSYPVIVAVIVQALWGLLKTAVKGPLTADGRCGGSRHSTSSVSARYHCSPPVPW